MAADQLTLESLAFVKAAFVKSLRAAFGDVSVPEQYRYDKDHAKRKVSIYRSWPARSVKYPLILVQAENVETPITTLGDEIVEEEYDETTGDLMAQVYGGQMWIPVTIEVIAKNIKDRDAVTQLAAFYIRHLFLPFFKKENLEYIDINIDAPDTPEEVQGENHMVGRITVKCQTEYKHPVPMTMFDALRAVNLSGLRFGSKEDDLSPEGKPLE